MGLGGCGISIRLSFICVGWSYVFSFIDLWDIINDLETNGFMEILVSRFVFS